MGQSAQRHIGRILLDGRFLSQQDLDHALSEQAHTKELLGQVLVRMGVLEAEDVKLPLIVQQHLGNVDDAVRLAAGERELLGELLIHSGHITGEQLDQVIAEQKRSGERLGEVFKRLGVLTEGQLNALLDFQHSQEVAHASPLRLGNLLVATGHITRQQLENALRQQAVSHKKLGEVLVESGYVNTSSITYGIRLQKMLLNAVLAAVISFGMSTASDASTVGLQWDRNSEPDVSGYKVYYSADPSTLEGSVPVDVHNQTTATISGLDPDKAYRFAVKAYNPAGQESPFSNIVSIAELSPPIVAITSPENATSVSGTVLISVTAADNVAVTKVEYYSNGQLLTTETEAPYTYSWNTASLAPGAYTLLTKAYDAAGNVGQSSTVSVTVVNDTIAPLVSLTAPGNNSKVNGIVAITASASDNVGVSNVEFYINGGLVFASNVSPYSFNWDTRSVPNGTNILLAKAYDNAGNVRQSSSVTVTVINIDPVLTATTLQEAYDIAAAGSGVVHLAAAGTIPATTDAGSVFTATAGKNVVISGGYDASNQTRSGVTVVTGSMKIRSGKVIAEGIVLRNPKVE